MYLYSPCSIIIVMIQLSYRARSTIIHVIFINPCISGSLTKQISPSLLVGPECTDGATLSNIPCARMHDRSRIPNSGRIKDIDGGAPAADSCV